MNLALIQPSERLHEIQTNGYIEVDDFLEQITFLYRNVPNKDQFYIKMMNKYNYLDYAAHSEMVRLDKLIQKNYADWYLHSERENIYITQRPDVLDLYHSLNLYGNKKSKDNNRKISMETDNIEKLIGLMIDIDIDKSIFSNLNTQEIYDFLIYEKIINGTIPDVNAVVHSGRGIHLIIKFKYPVPATEKSTALVNKMQNCFANEIREQLVIKENKYLKVDTLSLTTSTRVNTSYNSKNFTKVKFTVVNEELQELRELQTFFDKIKPYSRTKNKQKVFQLGMAKSAKKARKAYVLLEDRKNDLKKIQNDYKEHCIGQEEKMNFLYCNFTVQQLIHNYVEVELKNKDTKFEDIELTKDIKERLFKQAFEETLIFNDNFEKPYKPRQIRSKMNVLTRKNYKFKTETIIQWLNLDEDIQMNLKTIASKEVVRKRNKERLKKISEQRKADRRNENGLTKREQEKQDLINEIKELKNQGFKQKDIAEKLGIAKGTVSKYLKL